MTTLVVAAFLLVAFLVGGGVLLGVWGARTPPSYAEYRQLRTQIVPGTWEIVLSSLPASFDPRISLDQALKIGAGATPRAQIMPSLAMVTNEVKYVVQGKVVASPPTPSWVLVVRGLCYASDKGQLVSSSRRGSGFTPQRCTPNNISLLALDARTGKYVLSADGYDPTASWRPATLAAAAEPSASPSAGPVITPSASG